MEIPNESRKDNVAVRLTGYVLLIMTALTLAALVLCWTVRDDWNARNS